jgi:spermidine synthase
VLVIGGGDGGTVREILRHEEIRHVDLVEIDAQVIEVSRKYFPAVASAFDDRRLITHVRDGTDFVRNADPEIYDLVIVDSTDPVGFAEGLFGEDFYRACSKLLREHGMLVTQSESPFDEAFTRSIHRARALLGRLFKRTHVYLAHTPSYPMGTWSFTLATQGIHPIEDLDPVRLQQRIAEFADDLRYYNVGVHLGAFALPNFAKG